MGGSRKVSHGAGPNPLLFMLLLAFTGCSNDSQRTYHDVTDSRRDEASTERANETTERSSDGATTNVASEDVTTTDARSATSESDTSSTAISDTASDDATAPGALADGAACERAVDCASGVCAEEVCQAPSCADGVTNGGEIAQDCGGPCGGCNDGTACERATDCASGVCSEDVCQAPTCQDGVTNGGESAADCGGPCDACPDGFACNLAGDCRSGVCSKSECQAPTCSDGVLNGTETAQDCGGECGPCAIDMACSIDADCVSSACEDQRCVPARCGDGILALSEACDDSNRESGDGCSADCTAIEAGFACPIAGADCVDIQRCGDGQVQGNERCDLGDENSDTGECTTACQFPTCGDGFVQSGEQCDDGRLSGAYGTCDEGCVYAPRCGDGKVQSALEDCDKGEANNVGGYGGCTADCRWGPRCGDGIVDPEYNEECDDGDNIEVNGCGPSCRFTAGLTRWYRFEEGQGSDVSDFTGRQSAVIEYGRRYSSNVPYTEALVAPTEQSDGYVRLRYESGTDPTDSAETKPVVYVDLQDTVPHPSQLTLSVWGRRTKASSEKPMLLWLGSDGDGAGGVEKNSSGWAPHHEIWMRQEAKVDGEPNKYRMNIGFTPSYIMDIADYRVPAPSPAPETTSCRGSATVTLGDWHHFVLTIKNIQNPDGASLIRPVASYVLYVDGQRAGGRSECYTVNLSRFRAAFLGRIEFAANTQSWNGDADNFMMYSRVLTQEEVAELYASQKK